MSVITARRIGAALVVIALALLLYRSLLAERTMVDDLFIYLRYARALAERGEIAFSPGDRVEGTSSVVWTIVLGLAFEIGLRGVSSSKALSLVTMLAVPATSAFAVRRAHPHAPLLAAIPALAIALDCDVSTWGVSGMDTSLFTLACVACVALVAAKKTNAAAIALGLLPWVRPEGPLLTALGAIALALTMTRERRSDRSIGRSIDVVRVLLLAATPVAILVALRYAYFHDVLPNTFYAKMRAVDDRDYTGLGYAWSELSRRPLLATFGIALPLFAIATKRATPATSVALALAIGVVLFVIIAGGDWMPNRRLLVPAVALSSIAAALALPAIARDRALRIWPIAACAALLFLESAATTDRELDQRWRKIEFLDRRRESFAMTSRPFADRYALDWMPTHLMHETAPYVAPNDWVAHVDIGELPYVMADVGFIDGFGLVDRAAGRLTFFPDDASYRDDARREIFEKNPAAVIVVIDKETMRPFSAAQDAAMRDPMFDDRYRELSRVPTWGENPCVVFVRRDITPAPHDVADARIARWLAAVPDVRPAD